MTVPSEGDDLPVSLARALRAAGLRWHPAVGDRFVVTDANLGGDVMEGQVFTVSDMVVEVIGEGAGGPVLAFNGTTEWALDSVPIQAALWLPREGQLRRLLGAGFRRLEAREGGYRVVVRFAAATGRPHPDSPFEPGANGPGDGTGDAGGHEEAFDGPTAAAAYGQALLSVIDRALA